MEMVINAVMLLHLECANPIDSPRHGGAGRTGTSGARLRRRLPPSPLPPPSVPGRGARGARGAWPRYGKSGAARPLSGLPGQRAPPARRLRHARLSRGAQRGPRTHCPSFSTTLWCPQSLGAQRCGRARRYPGGAELWSRKQLAGGTDGGPLEAKGGPPHTLVRRVAPLGSVGSGLQFPPRSQPRAPGQLADVPAVPAPKARAPPELLLLPT